MSSASDQPLLLDVPPSRAPAPGAAQPPPPAPFLPPAPPPPPTTFATARLSLRDWLIDRVLLPVFRPLIARVVVWRWADANVMLHSAGTGVGGRYVSARTPWTRAFQETFTDPRFDEDHVMKSSRAGFTEAALNVIRYMAELMPGPVHLALDSAKEATDVNRDRLIPTLRKSFDREETDADDITGRVIRLKHMVIRVTGSFTEGAFRNKGNRVAILDEVEVKNEIDGAGTLHDLARSRQFGITGKKLFTMSKPLKWGSAHHREVVTGTLDVPLVPCPHCGTFQELTVDGRSLVDQLRIDKPIRPGQPPPSPRLAHLGAPLGRLAYEQCKLLDGSWDLERIQSETVYRCAAATAWSAEGAPTAWCRIQQDAPMTAAQLADPIIGPSFSAEVHAAVAAGRHLTQKHAMEMSVRWLSTNPRPTPRKRSRHFSDLHALNDDMTWGHFARIVEETQPDPARYRHTINNHFGLPHRDRAAEIGEEHVHALRSPYRRGTLPFRPDIVVCSADTQDAYWKYVVLAARLDSALKGYAEMAVITWGIAPTKSELLAILSAPLTYDPPRGPTETYTPFGGLVDAGGHRKDEVYELHFESGFRFFASYGRGGAALVTPTWEREIEWRMQKLRIYFYNDSDWKRRLYLGSILQNKEICDCLRSGWDPAARQLQPRLITPGAVTDRDLAEFEGELQGERLDEDGKWIPVVGQRNDYGDALKTARVTLELRLPAIIAERIAGRAAAAPPPLTPAP